MKGGEIFAGGFHLDFFDPSVLKQPIPTNPKAKALHAIRKALSILMMGWTTDGWAELMTWRFFCAVFIQRDPELLRYMRLFFQEGFRNIFKQLEHKKLSIFEQRQVDLYLSNCLCLLPFSDITPHEFIEIPQLINGCWVLVDYKVVPIELTSVSVHENARVFAYGLEPIRHHEAQPHLIFMGTTYPAGQGFVTQLDTDFEGFETAGKTIYTTGRKRITDWLDKQHKKAHVCGLSLGGSLALLLAADQGHKLSRVDALNPAGLYEPWFSKCPYDHWHSLSEADKPSVYIQKQGNDFISMFGAWKKDWHILHVIPPENKKGPNGFVDHSLNYAGFSRTRFIGIDALEDNKRRQWLTTYIYGVARGVLYYTVLLPFSVLRYLAVSLVYVIVNLVDALTRLFVGGSQVNTSTLHDANLPGNPSLNIHMNTSTALFSTHELMCCHEQDYVPSVDLSTLERNISITTSKFKMHEMKHTLWSNNQRACTREPQTSTIGLLN